MSELIRALAGRVKAAFAAHAALSAEADVAALDAERHAALLRQAARLDAEGLTTAADGLRKVAGNALACPGHAASDHAATAANGTNDGTQAALPAPAKKGR